MPASHQTSPPALLGLGVGAVTLTVVVNALLMVPEQAVVPVPKYAVKVIVQLPGARGSSVPG